MGSALASTVSCWPWTRGKLLAASHRNHPGRPLCYQNLVTQAQCRRRFTSCYGSSVTEPYLTVCRVRYGGQLQVSLLGHCPPAPSCCPCPRACSLLCPHTDRRGQGSSSHYTAHPHGTNSGSGMQPLLPGGSFEERKAAGAGVG